MSSSRLFATNLRRHDAVAVLLPPVVVFAIVASLVTSGAADAWDQSAMNVLEDQFASVPTPASADTVLRLALVVGILIGVAIGIALLAAGKERYALFWALAPSGVLVLEQLLKEAFRRPSVSGTDYSFPSGTAMLSMAALAAGVVLARRWWLRGIILVTGGLSVVAVGLSVVYVRWHYPSDVVAGWCAALVWVALAWFAIAAQTPDGGQGLDEPDR